MTELAAAGVARQAPVAAGPGRFGRSVAWMRTNLFNSVGNSVLTIVCIGMIGLILPPLFRWTVSEATLWGMTKDACTGDGACWTFIRVRLPIFIFGRYPADQRWRVVVAFALLVAFAVPVLRERTRHRGLALLALIVVLPVVDGVLLLGGVPGLPFVDTNDWGGLMLDVVIAFTTVAGALPLGIVLAFGRQSPLGVVRRLSVAFIELWRGVPLLAVLFMSAVMLPLFLPNGVTVDRLIRAMIAPDPVQCRLHGRSGARGPAGGRGRPGGGGDVARVGAGRMCRGWWCCRRRCGWRCRAS